MIQGIGHSFTAVTPPVSEEQVFKASVKTDSQVPSVEESEVLEFTPLRILGEGGMGVVYRALQKRPERIVALKVLKGPLSNDRVAQRFEREIGILARLHHRGIPQLFCVGKIDNGLGRQAPFMALEYIEGDDICTFADVNHLAASDRVALVAQVCDAVAYAHHHGVIHRDLKPANILVDLDGETKVLDFGLAALRDPLPPCTPLTQDGDCLGTLDYVSPEQANGDLDAIDERTDVYALGVILFELLTGSPPYKFAGASWSDAARLLLDAQPVRLSSHDRALRGDLETIVLKAMARDKAIRYSSAKAVADDLRRFLAHQPIQAKPPTQAYLCKKFIQRNKGVVAATATVFLSLSLGLAFTVRAERRATAEKHIAEVRLVQAHLAQGDGHLHSGELAEARNIYEQARNDAKRLGVSTLAADTALWELNTQSAVALETLCQSPSDIAYAALSKAEGRIALAHMDGRLEIFSLVDGSSKTVASGRPINRLEMSPDGHHLLVVYQDGFEIRSFGDDKPVASVVIAGHAERSAISNTWAMVTTSTGVYCASIDPQKAVPAQHVSADSKAIKIAGESLLVEDQNGVLTSETNGLVQTIGTLPKDHKSYFSPDGSQVAFQESGQCRILDCGNHLAEIARLDLPRSSELIAFCDAGRVVISNPITQIESVLDLSGKILWQIPQYMGSYLGIFGNLAISTDADGRCVLWAIDGELGIKHLVPAEKVPLAVAISSDGHLAAVAFRDHPVQLIDTATGAAIDVPDSLPTGDLAFCGKDQFLIIAQHKQLKVWDVGAQRSIGTFPVSVELGTVVADASYPQCFVRVPGWRVVEIAERNAKWDQQMVPSNLRALSIDTDGHGRLSISDSRSAEIWETQPGFRLASVLHSESNLISNLAFVDDGRQLVAQDALCNLQGWTAAGVSLGTLQTLPPFTAVASGSAGSMTLLRQINQITLWDAGANEVARRLPIDHAHTALSRDGKSVLVGTRRDGVSLLRLDTAERFRTACAILADPGQNHDRAARHGAYSLLDLDVHGW